MVIMMRNTARLFLVAVLCLTLLEVSAISLPGQSSPNPEQKVQFQPQLVTKTVNVINPAAKGSVALVLKPTELAPSANAQGKIKMSGDSVTVELQANGLSSPSSFGNEYHAFVAWAITAAGKPFKLGALAPKGNKLELSTTSAVRSFALLITVEPYLQVTRPADMVVLQSAGGNDTTVATCELLKGGYSSVGYQYPVLDTGAGYPPEVIDMYNARRIAQLAGGDGDENFRKGEELFNSVVFSAKQQKKISNMMLRQAVNATQYFEAARAKALQRKLKAQSK